MCCCLHPVSTWSGVRWSIAEWRRLRSHRDPVRAVASRIAWSRAEWTPRFTSSSLKTALNDSAAALSCQPYKLFTRTESPESLRSLARGLSGTQHIPGIMPRPKHSHDVSTERARAREEQGLEPRPIAPDGPWSPSTVLGILRNPRYAGMSTYTPKKYQADGGRRRSWRAQIVRDDAGEPVRGQWEAIVDDETWWRAQEVLDDSERVTNTSSSTQRKHLGSGLYLCGVVVDVDGSVCSKKVTGGPRGYRCAGHIVRSGAAIDEYVTELIAERLSQPDALQRQAQPGDSPAIRGISAAISEQRARILRAQRDYDAEVIEGRDLKRVRDAAEERIAELEAERLTVGHFGRLAPVLGTDDPAQAFREGSLDLRRQVITRWPLSCSTRSLGGAEVSTRNRSRSTSVMPGPAILPRAASCPELSLVPDSLVPEDKEL